MVVTMTAMIMPPLPRGERKYPKTASARAIGPVYSGFVHTPISAIVKATPLRTARASSL